MPPSSKRIRGLRLFLFLKDVALLSFTCFGGPQAHLAVFQRLLVRDRAYISDEELLELHALCQMLPGPTSTQTLTAIAFRIGGPNLAYLALLIWILPSVLVMTTVALCLNLFERRNLSLEFTRYLQPIAVGLVAQSAYTFARKTIFGNLDAGLMLLAAGLTYFFPTPYLSPLLIFFGGAVTAIRFRRRHQQLDKEPFQIQWANFALWIGVFLVAAGLGAITHSLPVRLFENFYRNGSLIFGGGQVLIPLLYNEFVQFKDYLTGQEFLFGYALTQSLPGPVFAFCSYIGVLSCRSLGWQGQIAGAVGSTLGIFLPGTFLIFFIIRFWEQLKRYRVVKASLEGVNAISSGLVWAAALLMFKPLEADDATVLAIGGTFILLQFTKVPAWAIILVGLLAGIFIKP